MRLISKDILRIHMEYKGYSHERLARYAGCSRGFISHLTMGRKNSCSTALAQRIAEALDVPLEGLFVPNVPSAGRQTAKTRKEPAA
jgi:transcriptional regulator with XRE-family HTH domain